MAKNFSVAGTFRNKNNAKELLKLKSNNLKLFEMDVVKENSILNVSNNIDYTIDYLICNAGINNGYGGIFDQDHSYEKMLEVLNVNVLGCILTIKHFTRNLRKNAKIILISSIMSVQKHSGSNALIYRASKAAVNNIMVSISQEFKSKYITVSSFHPGWVRTDMGGPNAPHDSRTAVVGLYKVILEADFTNTGSFYNFDGKKIPW